jgi:hypothetical protein
MMNATEQTMDEFKTWEEMTTLEQYACTYWDMYKDAYNVRPRGIDTSNWTEQDFEREFERLGQEIERADQARKEDEAQAAQDFESRVQMLLTSGAKNREMALRWIHEADGSGGDLEKLCFINGLPYGYFSHEFI